MITKLQIVNWPRQMNRLWSNAFPFAIINGEDDPFLNQDYFRRLAASKGWPHRLVEIENGKHAPSFRQFDVAP